MIAKIFLISGLAAYFARCLAPEQFTTVFDNGRTGYLYSVGGRGYIGQLQSKFARKASLLVSKDPESALPLKVFRTEHQGVAYGLIAAEEALRDLSHPNPELPRPDFADRLVFSFANDRGEEKLYLLPLKSARKPQFSFSPVILPSSRAFQVYANEGCLSHAHKHSFITTECVDTLSDARDNQLFIWIDASRIESDKKDLDTFGRAHPLLPI
ncbi:hypothetical protein NEDG_02095 [Nematocida displodere]|uniref:Uncharacterized protein n=1 Tax=Nematocida displodere TaxID=1805483 RepID=A0A177EKE9_9MICR|nr:hypothetical protein NEDG_02095 [Nematocida displodere]